MADHCANCGSTDLLTMLDTKCCSNCGQVTTLAGEVAPPNYGADVTPIIGMLKCPACGHEADAPVPSPPEPQNRQVVEPVSGVAW